ncbi:expressed unknown protein [Seminavis robusta]|uniref:Uncharacterized protein n=1 Tax=Seminavis robusta TaxID=568900 RepID=A0A9N8DC06_9STRA|nr:expressed unknown protein [Seminavis robusta]|eukprot:Sro11_g008990.1 n/a (246) ;mRNA; f:215734-216559
MSKEEARGYQQEESTHPHTHTQQTTTPAQRPVPGVEDESAQIVSDTTSSGIPSPGTPTDEQKPSAKSAASEGTTSQDDPTNKPRQVIAVSASRGPAAFFNLARKFLVTDETCDLSALEGAIVSAVDAAHLLERSKLATIIRVQTSYVTVEPKRRKQQQQASGHGGDEPQRAVPPLPESAALPPTQGATRQRGSGAAGGRELRRARIVITVKRTQSYERWLEENPLQAIIAGDGDDEASAEPVTTG